MRLILFVLMLTIAQAESTTCYQDGRWIFCDTQSDPFEDTAREEARERQEEHYERMEEHARNAAFAAEQAAYAAEARSYE